MGVFVPLGTRKNCVGYLITERGCWEFVGFINQDGYGQIWNSETKRMEGAHRFMFRKHRGPIPGGKELDHVVCDNRPCCNPWHVEPVTHKVNTLRGQGKMAKQARQTHCKRGHLLAGENLLPPRQRSASHRECRTCMTDYQKVYRETNRERNKSRRAAWRAKPGNADRARAACRARYAAADKDKLREINRRNMREWRAKKRLNQGHPNSATRSAD